MVETLSLSFRVFTSKLLDVLKFKYFTVLFNKCVMFEHVIMHCRAYLCI